MSDPPPTLLEKLTRWAHNRKSIVFVLALLAVLGVVSGILKYIFGTDIPGAFGWILDRYSEDLCFSRAGDDADKVITCANIWSSD